jgi:hypothetical protein
MREGKENWDRCLGKSPDTIYHASYPNDKSVYHEDIQTHWVKKMKEWFFPTTHAYPLPVRSVGPQKYTIDKYGF